MSSTSACAIRTSRRAPSNESARADEVDIWTFRLSACAGRVADLPAADRWRAAGFLCESRRRAFVRARVGLRRILASYLGADPRAIRLTCGPTGKPALAGPGGLTFSLAHAGDMAVCAVASGRAVGVDLEHLRPLPEAPALARALLPPDAAARAAALRPPHRDRALLACWTRIEAIGKADGRGIQAGLDVLSAAACALAPPGWRGRVGPYWLADLDLGPGRLGAVAVHGPREPRLRAFELSAADPTP